MNSSTELVGPISKLPCSSFCTFTAFRVKDAKVVWKNRNLMTAYSLDAIEDFDDWLLTHFAYTTLNSFYTNKEDDCSVFLAERYGGQLLAGNGGGGRVGLKGQFQCKGIGPTPLVNPKGPLQYSIGLATLEEMLNEALWGEVCHKLLPHGSVRCLAVIELGCINNDNERYAIAVRENELRLGHFELSPYFSVNHLPNLVSEERRVIASIESFPTCFSAVFGDYLDFRSSMETILYRYAEQLSYARLFRICHGSLTSSNIGLSGKYLDYGTISSLGVYENVATSRGNFGFLDEHNNILDSIVNFVDNYNWYSPNQYIDSSQLCHFFLDALHQISRDNFLMALGIKRKDGNFDILKADLVYEDIHRYLTMGGNKKQYGVPYNNCGNCFNNIINLVRCLRDPINCSSDIERRICNYVYEIVVSIDGFGLDYFLSKCNRIIRHGFNLDFLHYDEVRKEIRNIMSNVDLDSDISDYFNSILHEVENLKELL
ncbi:YdiU family protein [Vibrio cholerae]